MKTLALAAVLIVAALPAAQAQSSHGMDHSNMNLSSDQMEGAVHATGVVNSLRKGTANISHDPIPSIGWPAMTMDFAVMDGAKIMGGIKAGDSVMLMLKKGADGMYAISGMTAN